MKSALTSYLPTVFRASLKRTERSRATLEIADQMIQLAFEKILADFHSVAPATVTPQVKKHFLSRVGIPFSDREPSSSDRAFKVRADYFLLRGTPAGLALLSWIFTGEVPEVDEHFMLEPSSEGARRLRRPRQNYVRLRFSKALDSVARRRLLEALEGETPPETTVLIETDAGVRIRNKPQRLLHTPMHELKN